MGFILIPNDQELINNPNGTPTGYPMKFWGLFGKVAHITQQTFCDWTVCQNALFSLDKIHMAISQPILAPIQQN